MTNLRPANVYQKLMEDIDLTSYPIMVDNSTVVTATEDTFLQDAETYMTFKVAKYIQMYWYPVLIPLGFVGNTLSFLVMMRSHNRKVSTCIYMTAISINDNAMMCVQVFAWLIDFGKIQKSHDWQCYLFVYIEHSLLQWGTYLVLGMTIDKYMAIKWPHRALIFSTQRKAIITICAIIISGAMYNLPHFFITKVIEGTCYGYSVKSILTKVYSWTTFVINAVIPFTLLIHMNYVIIKTVKNSGKMLTSNVTGITRQKRMKSAENQLTTMLLLVTTLFLILLLPTYIRYVYSALVVSDTPSKFATRSFISELSFKLFVTNSGINFYLYCISGKKFRKDLKEIICCIRKSSQMELNVGTITSGIQS